LVVVVVVVVVVDNGAGCVGSAALAVSSADVEELRFVGKVVPPP
jgi:hypothetical protein